MTILHTPNYGIAYADTLTALTDLAAVTQEAAQTTDAALARGGVVPPAAADLAALAGRVAQLEGERTWTAWLTSTTYDAALTATPGAAVPSGQLSLTAGQAPAGRMLEVEARIPRATVAATSSVFVRLVDSIGGVLDGVEVSTGTVASKAPLRLRGDVPLNGAARTVTVQAWYSGTSANLSASSGAFAAAIFRYRII